jgi:hypothetical protein
MPRPSRPTAHHFIENAPTQTRAPSRASGFVHPPVADPRWSRLPLNYRGTILWHGSRFQIFLPDIGFLFQLIGQYQQVSVNQSIAVGWNARHSPQEFCFLAKLLNTDHVLNVSSLIASALDGRLVGLRQNPYVTF